MKYYVRRHERDYTNTTFEGFTAVIRDDGTLIIRGMKDDIIVAFAPGHWIEISNIAAPSEPVAMSHTPTPWQAKAVFDESSPKYTVVGANQHCITDYDGDMNKADAMHIVCCVNAHDELLAALKDALNTLEYIAATAPRMVGYGIRDERIHAAHQAIQKATS